jgi:hypothetical protein
MRGDNIRTLLSNIALFGEKYSIHRRNFTFPTQEIPKNMDLSEFVQDDSFDYLDEDLLSKSPATVYSGRFFEEVAISIFGGQSFDGIHNFGQDYLIQPDIQFSDNSYGEVKSCCVGYQPKLEREQLAKFALWLIEDGFPKIDFVFFQHGLGGIQRDYSNRAELVNQLRNNVLYAIYVPLSVPMQFFINQDLHPFKLREYPPEVHTPRGYANKSTLSLSARFLPSLLFNPEQTLEQINLSSEDFEIKKYQVEGLRVNRKNIGSFPLLRISSTDETYRSWFEKEKEKLTELANYFKELVEQKKVENIAEKREFEEGFEEDEFLF